MDNNTRVRYGRVDVLKKTKPRLARPPTMRTRSIPKNTLITVRDGELVHFGISRCNRSANDRFNKSTGRMIALNRANLAADEAGSWVTSSIQDFFVDESGLRGTVVLDSITQLLEYFRNLEEISVRKAG